MALDMDLRENYHALLAGIIKGLPAEKAFAAIGCYGQMTRRRRKQAKPMKRKYKKKYKKLTAEQMEQTRELAAMRETGATYREVAEKFSIPLSTVYEWIRRYREGVG